MPTAALAAERDEQLVVARSTSDDRPQLHSAVFGSQVVLLQTSPAQHGWPEPPQVWHRGLLPASKQEYGSPQKPPPAPSQQSSPSPPQPTQNPPVTTAKSAVQSTPPPQFGWPMPPHAPLPQLPATQLPVLLQAVLAATQRGGPAAPWSQQPLPSQALPSQHG